MPTGAAVGSAAIVAFVAFILGLSIAVAGTVGVVAPSVLAVVASALHGPLGLAFATILRLVLGTALFVAAPTSRAPLVFRALGAAIVAVGVLTPLMGVERFDVLLDWWATLNGFESRAWSACSAAIGTAIAYGIIPRDAR
jgi:hypothetical protein